MTEQMNGHTQPSVDQQLDQLLFPAVNMMCRGAVGSVVGIPADRILTALCRNFGRVVGMSYGVGDLGPLLKARGDAKKAFIEGLDAVKPQPKPAAPEQMPKVT